MLRAPAISGNARQAHRARVPPRNRHLRAQTLRENTPSPLQIVDNLHIAPSNRNMLKSPTIQSARAAVSLPRPLRHGGDAEGAIAMLQTNSLSMLVQRELERRILAGELHAGAKLNEAAIAEMLGVSRGPVREAFRSLEESGLVRLEKNRGVFVRQISLEEADEIYELRAALDEFAGRRVAQKASSADVRQLRALVERMDKAAARDELDAYYRANLEFHDRLVELAGNAKLLATYRRLVNELHLYRRASLAQAGALPISTNEHHDIVEKIAGGQAAAAGRALYEHVMGSRERMHRAHDAQATGPKPTRASLRRRQ
jgi:phosphonate utilization transcriptional regulator